MRTSNLLKCLLTALTLTVNMSCNSDVFIDEFLTETPAPISLTEEASEATISFEADNWDVWSIGSIGFETYPFICDEEGNGLTLPLENGGKDYQIFCRSDYIDFRMEKCDGRSLKLHLYENLYDSPWEWTIYVGNEYEQVPISVTLNPTGKYQIDSIVYDWSKFDFYDYMLEEVESLTVLNKEGTSPARWTCYPYKFSKRKVNFYAPNNGSNIYSELDQEQIARCLGDCSVTIPDTKDGKPVMGHTEAVFGSFEQEVDVTLDKNLEVKVSIDAGKNIHITVFNNMDCYHVPFTLYASHPRTGKRLEIPGVLYSQCPVNYLILKKDVTDEQP